jgi:uncharacterized OB-fold protein
MKVKNDEEFKGRFYYCPNCNNFFCGNKRPNYCEDCGTKLDWEEENRLDCVQIKTYLKTFIEEHNIKGICPQTYGIIENVSYLELWNLVCNLVDTYFIG